MSSRIDPSSGLVISPPSSSAEAPSEAVPCRTRNETVFPPSLAATTRNISYFRDMPEADFDLLLSNFVLSSYDPGSTIMLQGNSSRKFYVVASGEVEVLARTGYEDPLVTPSSYMGAVVNRLDVGNFFVSARAERVLECASEAGARAKRGQERNGVGSETEAEAKRRQERSWRQQHTSCRRRNPTTATCTPAYFLCAASLAQQHSSSYSDSPRAGRAVADHG